MGYPSPPRLVAGQFEYWRLGTRQYRSNHAAAVTLTGVVTAMGRHRLVRRIASMERVFAGMVANGAVIWRCADELDWSSFVDCLGFGAGRSFVDRGVIACFTEPQHGIAASSIARGRFGAQMSHGIAQRLLTAAEEKDASLRLSLQDLLQLHGEASSAVLLMLVALLTILPVVGAGTVLSLGLFALAWTWFRGRDTLVLPRRLAMLELNEIWTRRCLHTLAWTYAHAEQWLRPRWTPLSHAQTRSVWALWIALMAALIFLPLPLGNLLPGTSLMLLGLGWLFRDGIVLLLSAATGVAGMGYAVSIAHLAFAAWGQAGAWLGL